MSNANIVAIFLHDVNSHRKHWVFWVLRTQVYFEMPPRRPKLSAQVASPGAGDTLLVSESRLPSCGEIRGNRGVIAWGWVAFLDARLSAYFLRDLCQDALQLPAWAFCSALLCSAWRWWPGDTWHFPCFLITYGSYATRNHIIYGMSLLKTAGKSCHLSSLN